MPTEETPGTVTLEIVKDSIYTPNGVKMSNFVGNFVNVPALSHYYNWSAEELRLADYEKVRTPVTIRP